MAKKPQVFKALFNSADAVVTDLEWRIREVIDESTLGQEGDFVAKEALKANMRLVMIAWLTENIDLQMGEEEAVLDAADLEWHRRSLYGTTKLLRPKQ